MASGQNYSLVLFDDIEIQFKQGRNELNNTFRAYLTNGY